MAFGITILLPCLALLCRNAVGNVIPLGTGAPDPLAIFGEMPPEELAKTMEKFGWDAMTIYSLHDNKMLRDLAPPGTMGKIDVHMKMYLKRIDDLDLEHGILDCVAWLHMSWVDSRWAWTGKHSIPKMIFPAYMLWKPDMVLFNDDASNGHHTLMDQDIRVHVHEDGTVVYVEPLHIHSSCAGLHENYDDGDQVTCNMTFGSWTFDARRLSPVIEGEGIVDLTGEHQNEHWRVVGVTAEVETKHYEGFDAGEYATLTYSVTMEWHEGPDDHDH